MIVTTRWSRHPHEERKAMPKRGDLFRKEGRGRRDKALGAAKQAQSNAVPHPPPPATAVAATYATTEQYGRSAEV